jgi:hypothetical protein
MPFKISIFGNKLELTGNCLQGPHAMARKYASNKLATSCKDPITVQGCPDNIMPCLLVLAIKWNFFGNCMQGQTYWSWKCRQQYGRILTVYILEESI